MLNFKVNYTSADRVQRALVGLEEALGSTGRNLILRSIGQIYLHETERRFKTQSDPDRKKWRGLTKTTLKFKSGKVDHPSGRGPSIERPEYIGIWTGALASSINMRIQNDSVLIGSNVPHAPWFHYGNKSMKTWGQQPSRRFLGRNTRIDGKAINIIKSILINKYGIPLQDINNVDYGL